MSSRAAQVISEAEVMAALRRFWGYSSFRSLQHSIVHSLLEERDVCVVMPTGGGKSLCYQLPAALSPGRTVVVISPLIALMQDQVAQLQQMGIPAALLNSSLDVLQQRAVIQGVTRGEYRLLYLSPERLARADTVGWLQRAPIAFFAIDEAHCISEWGHEFRPEYRQLSALRKRFPDRPIAAFTASATRRVRHDIIDQLRLRDPRKYIASFHRANLHYVARQCKSFSQRELLVRALRYYDGHNVIVYAPTIASVQETVDFLGSEGIEAVPYHGQMEAATRRANQERWMSDEVRILVGTIAFGLGINKANVRAVIHLSLPKSLEQYYQEAGRAGRDGEPADCVLLWQRRDAGLLAYFIEKLTDAAEKSRAWQRYHDIRNYAETQTCRHRQICLHFGEQPKWQTCGVCDVCGSEPEWFSRRPKPHTVPQRPQAVAESEPQPQLVAQDHVSSDHDDLREYLREWRRKTAQRNGVPAFVVMHDTVLEEICRVRPQSIRELLGVMGIGERKAELYGADILRALTRFVQGERAEIKDKPASAQRMSRPAANILRLLHQGHTLEQIASIRGTQMRTVIEHLAELIEYGDIELSQEWLNPEKKASIEAACAKVGYERLRPIKDAVAPEISFDEIRLVVANLRRQRRHGLENAN